jgi:hypothetical protein
MRKKFNNNNEKKVAITLVKTRIKWHVTLKKIIYSLLTFTETYKNCESLYLWKNWLKLG